MKREIKFRGKTPKGKWFFGNFRKLENYCYVGDEVEHYCIEETIEQYTGLKDKNGIDIFEGDILKTATDKPMIVGWSDKFASFVLNRSGWVFSHWFGESCNPEDCEVIGNKYDNPELLQDLV